MTGTWEFRVEIKDFTQSAREVRTGLVEQRRAETELLWRNGTVAKEKQKRAPEELLRSQLKKLGVKDEHIDRALIESRKRDRIRSQIMGEMLKKLMKRIDGICEQREGTPAYVGAVRPETVTGIGGDACGGLAGIRDEIVRAAAALTLAGESISSRDDNVGRLSDSVFELQRTIRYMVWVLCVGMGVMVPGLALLLLLAIGGFGKP